MSSAPTPSGKSPTQSAHPLAIKPTKVTFHNGLPYSTEYDDLYFALDNNRPSKVSHHPLDTQDLDLAAQAKAVFIEGGDLPLIFSAKSINCVKVGELGFGAGVNFITCVKTFLSVASPHSRLNYCAFDKHLWHVDDMRRLHLRHRAHQTLYLTTPNTKAIIEELLDQWPQYGGIHRLTLANNRIALTLIFGDFNQTVPAFSRWSEIYPNPLAVMDAWFLDGFAPSRNPSAWTPPILDAVSKMTKQGGKAVSWTSHPKVLQTLAKAGFKTDLKGGFGQKKYRLVATKVPQPELPHTFKYTPPSLDLPSLLPQNSTSSVCISGGGISGSFLARELAGRNIKVTIYDPKPLSTHLPTALLHIRLSASVSPQTLIDLQGLSHTLRHLNHAKYDRDIYTATEISELLLNARSLKRGKKLARFLALSDPNYATNTTSQWGAQQSLQLSEKLNHDQFEDGQVKTIKCPTAAIVQVQRLLANLQQHENITTIQAAYPSDHPPFKDTPLVHIQAHGHRAEAHGLVKKECGQFTVHRLQENCSTTDKLCTLPPHPLCGWGYLYAVQDGSIIHSQEGVGQVWQDKILPQLESESYIHSTVNYRGTKWVSTDRLPLVGRLPQAGSNNNTPHISPKLVMPQLVITGMGGFALARAPLCATLLADILTSEIPALMPQTAMALFPENKPR